MGGATKSKVMQGINSYTPQLFTYINIEELIPKNQVLEQISKIYKIVEEVRGLPPEERQKRGEKNSKELIEELFVNFKKILSKLAQKGSTALAIKYALNNEIALKRF